MLEKLYYVMVVMFIIYLVVCLITYMPRMRGWFASFKKQEKLVSKSKTKWLFVYQLETKVQL